MIIVRPGAFSVQAPSSRAGDVLDHCAVLCRPGSLSSAVSSSADLSSADLSAAPAAPTVSAVVCRNGALSGAGLASAPRSRQDLGFCRSGSLSSAVLSSAHLSSADSSAAPAASMVSAVECRKGALSSAGPASASQPQPAFGADPSPPPTSAFECRRGVLSVFGPAPGLSWQACASQPTPCSGVVLCRTGVLSSHPVSSSSSIAEPESLQARFPGYGPLLLATLSGDPPGSHEFNKRAENAAEARLTLSYLRDHEPACFARLAEATALKDSDIRTDQMLASLARQKKPKVSKARRALRNFRAWQYVRRDVLSADDPLGPSSTHFAMYAVDSINLARSKGFAKDFSGQANIDSLVAAAEVLGARFQVHRLKHSMVSAACERSSFALLTPVSKAVMPLSYMFQLEDIALGPYFFRVRGRMPPPEYDRLPVQALHYARASVLVSWTSLRLVDGLRAARATDDRRRLLPIGDAGGPFFDLAVAKSKNGKPIRARLPVQGVSPGAELWVADFLDAVGLSPSFFPSATYPHGHAGDISQANGWHFSRNCCSSENYSKAIHSLLALPPLCISKEDRTELGITGRARATFPECAEALGWQPHDTSVLGEWASPPSNASSSKRRKTSVPTCKTYAPLAIGDRQLEIRRRMMSAMAALVGADQQWTDVIPLQNSSSQPVSFRFVNVSRAARVAGGSADLD